MDLSTFRHLVGTCLALSVVTVGSMHAQPENIRINQIGFYPDGPKAAIVVDAPATSFYVTTADLADTVFTGTLGVEKLWSPSREHVRRADFSSLDIPGTYVLTVPGVGASYPFEVSASVHQDLAVGAIKAYYYQRASLRLRPAYAGIWFRALGHPDTEVLVHASAATTTRPAGTKISAPKGWYDAGDYNKYIVNSGISTGTLLMLYEHYGEYLDALDTNIPESGNGIPDVLDEILWNVRWMMSMQDPDDGGVYHKLTTPYFEGVVMPALATQTRYVVKKSTPAALDFAAVAAIASRVVAPFMDELPGLSDSLLTAAQAAWNWAQFNSYEPYSQNAVNQGFDPDISTGEYGDGDFYDEFQWAATELFITTAQDSFVVMYSPPTENLNVPGWPNVRTMSTLSLVHHRGEMVGTIDTTATIQSLTRLANQLVEDRRNSAYEVVMGASSGAFFWGCNSDAANQAMILLSAYRVTNDPRYLDGALSNLDYLLGRNGTGYSFVTGFGDRTPHHPHHRPSEADSNVDPVPGLLVGGPNPGQEDGCSYPSDLPAQSYSDTFCSYASNEIAINWNAPLAYVATALEATFSETGIPTSAEMRGESPGAGGPMRLETFPNPSRERTMLRLALKAPRQVKVEVFDVTGRRLFDATPGLLSDGRHEIPVDVSYLPSGFYVVRVDVDGETRTGPLVVVR